MTKKDRFTNDLKKEKIEQKDYSEVMQDSYMSYTMSVITSRAIPDVRDGLKPVHRRILYDMDLLNLDPSKGTRKSARIVGDTMGKFHPHGDSSIYEALAAMTREYKENVPLIYGQGNFGSPEGDEAAAMRYTEAKLQEYTKDILLDYLHDNTVDYIPNYDDEELEPSVLPAKLPQLLIGGTQGISVAFSSSILPHNVSEVIDANIYGLNSKKPTLKGYLKYIKGPDFPSAGYILNAEDLENLYKTGTGQVQNSGKIEIEKLSGGKSNLIITEIPYSMIGDGVNKFISKVGDLVVSKVLSDVTEIKNESNQDGPRIVLSLKKDADIEYVKSVLLNKTDLSSKIRQNFMVIQNGRPKILSLDEYFDVYIDFQKNIYKKRFISLLKKSEEKLEIVSGLVKAVDVIDIIIAVIRGAKNSKNVKECLMMGNIKNINLKTKTLENKAKKFNFTEKQANAILNMRLSKLVGLEIEELKKEHDCYKKEVHNYSQIVENEGKLINEIKKDLRKYKKKYGKTRKTQIIDKEIKVIEKEVPEENLVVLIDSYSYIHAVTENVYNNNKDDIAKQYKYIIPSTNKREVLVFTSNGDVHAIKVEDLPVDKYDAKGIPVDDVSNFDLSVEEIVGADEMVDESDESDKELTFLLSNGNVKRVDIKEFTSTRKTVKATNLPKGEKVSMVIPFEENKNVIINSNLGKFIRFRSEEISKQKKNSIGVKGLKLDKGEMADSIGFYELTNDTFEYKNKTYNVVDIRLKKRGNKGIQF